MPSTMYVNLGRVCREHLGLPSAEYARFVAQPEGPLYCATGLRIRGNGEDCHSLEIYLDDVETLVARIRVARAMMAAKGPDTPVTQEVNKIFVLYARASVSPNQPWGDIYESAFVHNINGVKDAVRVLAEIRDIPERGCYFAWLTKGNRLQYVSANESEVRATSPDYFRADIAAGWGRIVALRITEMAVA